MTMTDTELDTVRCAVPTTATAVALRAAALAVSRDKSRTHLGLVQIQATGGLLTVAATDSYRLHVATVDLPDAMAEVVFGPVLVSPAFALDAAKVLEDRRSGSDEAEFVVEPHMVTVQRGTTVLGGRVERETFPQWRDLFDRVPHTVTADAIGMNADYLADICKAVKLLGKGHTVELVGGEGGHGSRPMHWKAASSDDLVVLDMLLMPVRA